MAAAGSRFVSAGLIPVALAPDGSIRVLLHRQSGDDHMRDFGGSKLSESADFTESVIDVFVHQTYGLFTDVHTPPALWLYRRIAAASAPSVHWALRRGHVVALLPVPFLDAALLDAAAQASDGGSRSFFWLTPSQFAVAPLSGDLLVPSLRATVADTKTLLALFHDLCLLFCSFHTVI